MKKIVGKKAKKKIDKKFLAFVILGTLLIFVSVFKIWFDFRLKENISIELSSKNYGRSGTFRVLQEASWIGSKYAKISNHFESVLKSEESNLNIVLVIDILNNEEDLKNVIRSVREFVNIVTGEHTNNRVRVVTVNHQVLRSSDFLMDSEKIIAQLNSATTSKEVGLDKVLSLLDEKEKEDDTVLNSYVIITDRMMEEKEEDVLSSYQELKTKENTKDLNIIKYDSNELSSKEDKVISDNYFKADLNTLKNVLLDVTVKPTYFESIVLTEDIDSKYFTVDSIDDIHASVGTVNLEKKNGKQRVIWTIDDNEVSTGEDILLEIDFELNKKYQSKDKIFLVKTSKMTKVEATLPNADKKVMRNFKSPVLKNRHLVSYEMKLPEGCNFKREIENKTYAYNELVEIETRLPNCNGYQFKGWQFKTEGISEWNNGSFRMPNRDVLIVANWEKFSSK